MKIARISVYQVDLWVPGGAYYLSGGRNFSSFDSTVVSIEADDGSLGWGEACPFGKGYLPAHGLGVRAGIAAMAPSLIGLDPRDTQRIGEAMEAVLPGLPDTKAAIDAACWDLFGRATGLPCYRMLGGLASDRLPLVSSVSTEPPRRCWPRPRTSASRAIKPIPSRSAVPMRRPTSSGFMPS